MIKNYFKIAWHNFIGSKGYSIFNIAGYTKSVGIALCCLFTLTVQSQDHQGRTNISNKQERLPGLKDWFLSTGNWERDPQLYIREFGTGRDTIIMLHGGWGAEHSGFLNAVMDLGDQFHFIFYDQRGSLRSPCPDSLITFDYHIEDVELLRKELNMDKLNIVGHSMGAVLASAYAEKYPERIRQLALFAPMYLKQPIPKEDTVLQQQGNIEMQAFMDRPEVTRELDKYGLNRKTPALSSREETIRFRINTFAKRMLYDVSKWPDIIGGRALYKGHVFQLTAQTYPASGWDYLQEFKTQAYPVSIIVGDHDFLDYKNHLIKKWVSGISQVKLTVIKNAGHLLWLDQPKEFTKQLAKQLKR